jgi:hypothetical protein
MRLNVLRFISLFIFNVKCLKYRLRAENNMARIILYTVFFLVTSSIYCVAQRSHRTKVDKRFSAGLIGGLSMSQLDGDNYTGYDYKALFGGLKVSAFLHDKLTFDVNFLYIRKGASIENEEIEFRVSFPKDRLIHLSYVEIPFLFSLKPNGKQSKLYFEGGAAFSKLIDTKIQENVRYFTDVSFEQIGEDLSSNDVSAIIGIGSYFTKNMSIGMRFSYGLNKIYIKENPIFRETLLDILPRQVFFLKNY